MSLLSLALTLLAAAGLGAGQTNDARVGQNAQGDLEIDSAPGRSIITNGVDLLANITAQRHQIDSQRSTIAAQSTAVVALERRQESTETILQALMGGIATMVADQRTRATLLTELHTNSTRDAAAVASAVRTLVAAETAQNRNISVLNANLTSLVALIRRGGLGGGGGGGDATEEGDELNSGWGSSVEGDVRLQGQDSFEVLSKMRAISSVYVINITGFLHFSENVAMTNVALEAFSRLRYLGQDLRFDYNNVLTSVHELGKLETIGGDLVLNNNGQLRDVSGFDNVTSIAGRLAVSTCNAVRLEGSFKSLEEVGEIDLHYDRYNGIITDSNPLNISGFGRLVNITGGRQRGHVSLTGVGHNSYSKVISITGFHNVTEIPGDLAIRSFYRLRAITAFPNVTRIGGSLIIGQNHELSTVTLGSLEEIGGNLEIYNCNSLGQINMPNLRRIRGYVKVYNMGRFNLNSMNSFGGSLQCTQGIYSGNFDQYCRGCPERFRSLSAC